jgi:glycosyltransferase involved in cell wall biosynthesis
MSQKVSVLIPSRNEQFLKPTVTDLVAKAAGDVEVIVVLDGYWPDDWGNFSNQFKGKVHTIHRTESRGMRDGINSAARIARGRYLMKSDAHCSFEQGWDQILKADCDEDWVVVPRRDRLDPENWCLQQTGKPPIDYHYLSFPWQKPGELGMHGNVWGDRAIDRHDLLIDDEMSSQGSCWFTTKKHFDRIGGLPEEGYGTFVQEFQQLGLKTWLSGGRVVINKKTTYLHLHKGKSRGRGYFISKGGMVKGTHWSADYWINNRWAERKYDLEWLIDKFWPVPSWPENWRDHVNDYRLGPDGYLVRSEKAA